MASVPPSPTKVLVVDDEPGLREVLSITFRRNGFDVVVAPGVRAAIEAIGQVPQPFPLVLTDLIMPDGSGLAVLNAAKARSSATEVIVMTAHSTVEAALDAMKEALTAIRARAHPTRCPTCRISFTTFKDTGRFGCPNCYEHFRAQLKDLLPRVHAGAYRHRGKTPGRR